jgi:hypothetical protein
MENSRTPTSQQREASLRAANSHFEARENRASVAKQELETARVAADAKTARLRALRLEKEQAERDALEAAPAKPTKRG